MIEYISDKPVFDIGANLGSATQMYLDFGASKVIAVEPNPKMVFELKKLYDKDNRVVIVNKAVGSNVGKEIMWLSDCHTLSTMSEKWKTGRFKDNRWRWEIKIKVITLDSLIEEYGLPSFIKIDVEGYEYQVVQGLSIKTPLLSFEYTSEFIDDAYKCLDRLEELGYTDFMADSLSSNIFQGWIDRQGLNNSLTQGIIENPNLWGNVYAK